MRVWAVLFPFLHIRLGEQDVGLLLIAHGYAGAREVVAPKVFFAIALAVLVDPEGGLHAGGVCEQSQ